MDAEPGARYERILLTRMRFIGDIVLTTPLIRSVRAACPDARIAYMGERDAVALLEGNPFLDEIIPYSYSRPGVLEQARVGFLLRKKRFDLVVDFFGNPRSALLTRLSGAPVRVGPERSGRGRLYTIRVADDGRPKTAVEFHNQYIAAAGIPPVASKTELFLTEDEKRDAVSYLRWVCGEGKPLDPGRPIVGIHPGGTWPAKKWLPERFAELADTLRAKLGATVIITAGPLDTQCPPAPAACRRDLVLQRVRFQRCGTHAYCRRTGGPDHRNLRPRRGLCLVPVRPVGRPHPSAQGRSVPPLSSRFLQQGGGWVHGMHEAPRRLRRFCRRRTRPLTLIFCSFLTYLIS